MSQTSPDLERAARNLARLAQANQARRCVHVKPNGLRCGSPAMRGDPFCFFHDRWYNQPAEDTFPSLEDGNGVQLALMQVAERLRREAFRAGSINPRLVQALVFVLKVAGQNARHTTFDGAGLRDRFVTDIPRARIPDHELSPADTTTVGPAFRPGRAAPKAQAPPRSEPEADGGDQAQSG